MSTREALATALTIPDLTKVTPYYRQSLKAGDGFVRIGPQTRDTSGFGFMQSWEVWLALPSDMVAAEKWLDANLAALVDAARSAVVVTAARPSELVLGGGTVNGLIIAGSAPA